ncbi:Fic family protein [Methanoregula sp.]|uniref:Fic family protein n=1 Tax=Methanoregula sp. TaxID=2052170 RepID=UPI0025D7D50D|nr:Fic/DOC family N-terminal domain-containing protein [Methanoregula sp.]
MAHIPRIGKANAALARYDGLLQGIINPEILLSPLTIREAVLSSRIEGTQASLEEVLQFEADQAHKITPEKRLDIQEIINYRSAMRVAVEDLGRRPICANMIRDLHRILLTSVRGRDREPGEIRRIQNYIAPYGTPIERATFIPPPPNLVPDALTNWENYLHSEERDPLVQLAVLKAQFELIHPFRDGNGRIGRMLVPIILYNKKILSTPMFYISAYLEAHRDEYYDNLLAVSRDNDWNGWIGFFLQALIEQATENNQKATAIIELYEKMKKEVPEATHSQYAVQAIDTLFSRPIFKSADFIAESKIPKPSAHRILKGLTEADILTVSREGKGKSPTIYRFSRLIAITESSSG